MSLGEIQQLYSNLQEIDVLLNNITAKTDKLKVEAGHARGELREVEYIFYRLTSLLGRMGLPKEIDHAIMILQRLILTIRILHSALIFMQMGTPYGVVLAAFSIMGATITAGEMATEFETR